MDIAGTVAQSLISRCLDWAFRANDRRLPLTTGMGMGVAFSPYYGTFLFSLYNRTDRAVVVKEIKLRAFGKRKSWFQPLDLKLFPFGDGGDISKAFGLQDGAVPPFAVAMFGGTAQHLGDRVMNATRLEFVALDGTKTVWRYRMRTRWLRHAVREAAIDILSREKAGAKNGGTNGPESADASARVDD